MEQRLDPHNYEKRLNSIIKAIEKSDLSDRNKELIFRFRDSCIMDGLSKPRIEKLMEILKSTAFIFDKDFDTINRKDVERFVTLIQQREYSPWTKQSYKIILRKFYKWLKGTEDYPEEVKWVKTSINKNQLKLPTQEGLITEDDLKLLVKEARNIRDKAFISLLYESGCRISELLTLRIKNVSFDEYGALLNVFGKTGSRKIRIIGSTSYLVTWLHTHPFKDDNDSALWINYGQKGYNKPMMYSTTRMMLMKLFKRCGIKKRYNPHLFRHSRATYLANHLTEFQMNQYFGWIQGSNMPATYVHLSGRETDSALLALSGIKKDENKKESTLKPIKCPRCENINSYDAKFCGKCAGILDIQTAMQLEDKRQKEFEMRNRSDELMNKLMMDPEVERFLKERIAMMGMK